MCGIAALFRPGGLRPEDRDALRRMTDSIRHRGPDDEGFWFDEARGVGLSQRRLAIQDLSPAGAQPMLSASGALCDHVQWRDLQFQRFAGGTGIEVRSPQWRGHSDTEVLLALIEARGPEAALKAATGMFALVLLDRQDGAVYIARDRIGEKPLYIAEIGGAYLLPPNSRPSRRIPDWDGTLDHAAITGFCATATSPRRRASIAPRGSCRRAFCAVSRREPTRDVAYWDSLAEARAAKANRFTGTFEEATDKLDALLHAAIRRSDRGCAGGRVSLRRDRFLHHRQHHAGAGEPAH